MIKWLDLTAVVIPLAQSIGRFGNFFNKELYGSPTRLPWGMYIPLEYRPDTYINNDVFHPLFIYESISNILLFSLLFLLFKGKNVLGIKKWYLRDEGSGPLPDGFFVGLYFIGYGIIRFLIEFLKIDIWWFFGLNMAQVICFGFILGGFWWLKKIKKS